ncbi:lysophospholipid acyltransferase family protein, partial [Candidatus Latescibacterota bacterium]
GHLVGMLVDQDIKVKGDFVDFFGKPAHTAIAPALLSLKFDIPIIPLFSCRDEKDIHHIYVGERITTELSGDKYNDILSLTDKASLATEAFIREHPEQWVWFHRRWKTRPDNENQPVETS